MAGEPSVLCPACRSTTTIARTSQSDDGSIKRVRKCRSCTTQLISHETFGSKARARHRSRRPAHYPEQECVRLLVRAEEALDLHAEDVDPEEVRKEIDAFLSRPSKKP